MNQKQTKYQNSKRLPARYWLLALVAVILYWNSDMSMQVPFLVHPNAAAPGMDVYHVALEFGPAQVGGLGSMITQHTKSHASRFPHDRVFVWHPWSALAESAFKGECTLERNFMTFQMVDHLDVEKKSYLAEVHACPMNHYNVTVLFADLPKHTLYREFMGQINRTADAYVNSSHLVYYYSQVIAHAMELHLVNSAKTGVVRPTTVQFHSGKFGLVASMLRHPNKDPYTAELLQRHLSIFVVWHDYYYEYFVAADANYPVASLEPLVHEPEKYVDHFGKPYMSMLSATFADATICVSEKMRDALRDSEIEMVGIHDRWLPAVTHRPFLAVSNNIAFNDMRHNPWRKSIQLLSNGDLRYEGKEYTSLTEVKRAAKLRVIELFKSSLGSMKLENKTWIIYTGRFDDMKGSLLLLAAAKAIRAKPNVCLLVVMRSRVPNEEFRSALLQESVILFDSPEFESGYGTLFRLASDIGLIPSRQEAFGLVGIEAFLYGQMLVSSKATGLLEFSHNYGAKKQKQQQMRVRNKDEWQRTVSDCVAQWGRKSAPKECYNLMSNSPFAFNNVQFNVHPNEGVAPEKDDLEMTKALEKAIPLYQSMNALHREQFLWHLVANAGAFIMEREGGMLDQYRDIYVMGK